LAAIHNFIKVHSPQATTHLVENDSDHAPGGFYAGDDSLIPTGAGVNIEDERDTSEASRRRNRIADDMWRQYQEILHQRSQAGVDSEDEDLESDGELEVNEGNDDSDNDFYV
jgi:hypothetical protein